MPTFKFEREDIVRDAEMDKLLQRARDIRVRTLAAFLYVTGAKVSQALRLTANHISFDDTTIYITLTVHKPPAPGSAKSKPELIELSIPKDSPYVDTILLPYFKKLKALKPTGKVWPWGRVKAWAKIKRLHPKGYVTPLILRHSRLQQIAEEEDDK